MNNATSTLYRGAKEAIGAMGVRGAVQESVNCTTWDINFTVVPRGEWERIKSDAEKWRSVKALIADAIGGEHAPREGDDAAHD